MKKSINHGLIIPEITPDNWVLGGLTGVSGKVINKDGNWIPYVPEIEPQSKQGIETQACTAYATLNAIETLLEFYGYLINYSDRYLAIVGKIDPHKGANPHNIAETIRKISGCIAEEKLSFSEEIKTVEEYYNIPDTLITQLLLEGQQWYKEWEFSHEWVFTSGTPQQKREKLKEALTKGTVCVSVYAWAENDKGEYYKPEGAIDGHWVVLTNVFEDGYTIFDSYDGYFKKLTKDFDFNLAKIYYLKKKEKAVSLWQRIKDAIKGYLTNLFK